MANVSKEQLVAAVQTARAIADAIRGLGEVPSGHLYAQVMSHMSLETYNAVIDMLIRSELVTRTNHVLRWVGPAVEVR